MAPAHGLDDYKACRAAGISAECVVDGEGRFTSGAPAGLAGQHIWTDGTESVLRFLGARGLLAREVPYKHRYPYDWRAKKPVIFRATEQWFCRLDAMRKAAADALEGVHVVP